MAYESLQVHPTTRQQSLLAANTFNVLEHARHFAYGICIDMLEARGLSDFAYVTEMIGQ